MRKVEIALALVWFAFLFLLIWSDARGEAEKDYWLWMDASQHADRFDGDLRASEGQILAARGKENPMGSVLLNDMAGRTSFTYSMFELGGFEPVVTDSVVWKTVGVDSVHVGDANCEHEWVNSKLWHVMHTGCDVLHYGFHCSLDDAMRHRICKKCLRKETQREQWYQHRSEHVETEYEKLEKRLEEEQHEPAEPLDTSDNGTFLFGD